MPRSSYQACPYCGRLKAIEAWIRFGDCDHGLRGLRCLTCAAQSIDGVTVRCRGAYMYRDNPVVAQFVAKKLRQSAEKIRAGIKAKIEEMERDAAEMEAFAVEITKPTEDELA